MKRTFTLLALFMLVNMTLSAQKTYKYKKSSKVTTEVVAEPVDTIPEVEKKVLAYVDSLKLYKAQLDSVNHVLDSLNAQRHIGLKDLNYRLFTPLTYYPDIVGSMFDGTANNATNMDSEVSGILLNTYFTRPDLVRTTVSKLHESAAKSKSVAKSPVTRKVEVVKEVKHEEEVIGQQTPVELVIVKPNFWKFQGDYNLQFMQSHLSENWYQSGESNLAMSGSVTLQANYNNKQKVKWDNKLEMKLGFQTSESDTLHKVKTSSDLLRYTGKLGIQASKRWYYTLQVIASTQFAHGLKSNDSRVYSDFLSPITVNVSPGMDYTIEAWKKKLTGTIHLAPFAYNWKYVGRLDLATRYGIDEGHHSLQDYGSQFTLNVTWKPTDNIKWQSRMYAYTTYHRMEYQWENTINFAFNKYISTQLFLYPRFDDGVNRVNDMSYWQFKEFFSLGFTYSM